MYQFVSRQWYVSQEKIILREKALIALKVLDEEIQSAGYRGCLSRQSHLTIQTLGHIAPYFCPKQDLIVQGARAYRHISEWAHLALPKKLIFPTKGDFKVGSDFLILYHVPIVEQTLWQNQSIAYKTTAKYYLSKQAHLKPQSLILVSDCYRAIQFQSTSSGTMLPYRFSGGAQVVLFETASFYVAPAVGSFKNARFSGVYGLFRDNLESGQTATGREEIITDVEDFCVEYGLLKGNKGQIIFIEAHKISDWRSVKAIKIHLLLKSERKILNAVQSLNFRNEKRVYEDGYYREAFEQISVLKNAS